MDDTERTELGACADCTLVEGEGWNLCAEHRHRGHSAHRSVRYLDHLAACRAELASRGRHPTALEADE